MEIAETWSMSANSTKDRLKAIQKTLQIKADGILGPVTLTGIETLLEECLSTDKVEANSRIDHHLTVSRKGLEQIIAFEISSVSYYRKHLKHPIWPGGGSGITIGIGYDLGYHSRSRIKKDWGGKIPDADLETLLTVSGKKGESAREALPDVRHIEIPIQTAKEVFYTCTLPTFAALTRKAFPGVEKLPADAQARCFLSYTVAVPA